MHRNMPHQQADNESVHAVIEASLLPANLRCDLTATDRELEAPQDTSEDLRNASEVHMSPASKYIHAAVVHNVHSH